MMNNPVDIPKVKWHPKNNWLKNNGYTVAQESELYDQLLTCVATNPRWFSDNYDRLPTYRLSWVDYKREHCSVRYCHRQETPRRNKSAKTSTKQCSKKEGI